MVNKDVTDMSKAKLYKSRDNSVVFGVIGGISEYFNIDPLFLRVMTVIVMMMFDNSVLLYIILAFILPKEPIEQTREKVKRRHFFSRESNRFKRDRQPVEDVEEINENEWSDF